MPIYEYRCPNCGHKTSLFFRQISSPPTPDCPSCAQPLTRLYSSFAYRRSLKSVHEASGDPDRPGPDYYRDPRNIGRWAEKRLQQMGIEMPPQLQETIQAAREGELPGATKDLQPNINEV